MSWVENPGSYNGLELSALGVDEAYVNFTLDRAYHLYKLVDECHKCPFTHDRILNDTEVLKVSTKFGTSWRLYEDYVGQFAHDGDKNSLFCEFRLKNFGEFGVYSVRTVENQCDVTTDHQPVNIYLPLILILGALFGVSVVASIVSFLRIKWNDDSSNVEKLDKKRNSRITAIDAFRGICIVLMIFVNGGGGQYNFLSHATWNGLNVADLLFPWFMWIMGLCIPIAIRSQLRRNLTRLQILSGVLKRSCMLFVLGLCVNTVGAGANLSHLRIFGVLQRFAVVYFVVAVLVTFLMISLYRPHKPTMKGPFSDIANLSVIWVLMFSLVGGYCYLTFYFPVPGCPAGYLGPGGIHYNELYENCTGGVAGYIDKLLLTTNHIYQHPTASAVYLTGAYDPEGPYGCLMSIFQVFLGVQAGAIILSFQGWQCRVKRWLIWGFLFGILGTVLCQGRQEGGWIPLNKNLWSLSFVAVTSSFAFIVTSFLHYIIDVKRLWSGAPFIYPGMNAILLYVGHEVAYNLFPFHWSYGSMNTHFVLTLEAMWNSFLWTFISYLMYKKKCFLSL